jgi:hypothetical protein
VAPRIVPRLREIDRKSDFRIDGAVFSLAAAQVQISSESTKSDR